MFRVSIGTTVFYIVMVWVLAACGGGTSVSGGGIVATGKAEINGNVSSSWQGSGLGGISVSVDQQQTRTDANGRFLLQGVEPGSRQLQFSQGANRASMQINTVANKRVTLNNVRLQSNKATPGSVSRSSTNKDDDSDNDDDGDSEHGDQESSHEDEQGEDDDRNDDNDSDDEHSDSQEDSDDDDPDDDREDDDDDDRDEPDDDDCDDDKPDCKDD